MATEVKLVIIEGGETKPGGECILSRELSSLDFIFLKDRSLSVKAQESNKNFSSLPRPVLLKLGEPIF